MHKKVINKMKMLDANEQEYVGLLQSNATRNAYLSEGNVVMYSKANKF